MKHLIIKSMAAAIVACVGSSAAAAPAAAITCSAVNGTVLAGEIKYAGIYINPTQPKYQFNLSSQAGLQLASVPVSGGISAVLAPINVASPSLVPSSAPLVIALEVGDVVSIDTDIIDTFGNVKASFPGKMAVSTASSQALVAIPDDFSATIADDYTFNPPAFDNPMLGTTSQIRATLTCTPAAVDTPAETEEDNSEDVASASILSQNSTIMRGLRSVRTQTNGGDVQVTRNKVMAFMADDASGWRVWGFTDFRRYSEAADGSSIGLSFGIDRSFGNTRIGGLLAYDMTTLDSGSGDEEVTSLAIGPYISGTSGAFSYDAFITYARPEYELASGNLTGERVSYGLTGAGAFDVGANVVSPFLSMTGAREELDGNTLTTQIVSAGLRVDFAEIGGINPYLSIAYESTEQDSALTGNTKHEAPRVGFGFSAVMNHGAIIGVDIDAGESVKDLRDVGVRISYSLEF